MARITAEVKMGEEVNDTVSLSYKVLQYPQYSTPDTAYEETAPEGFTVPSVPTAQTKYATWWQWSYSSNKFTKTNYGIGIDATVKEKLQRADPNVSSGDSAIKSGYAFKYYGADTYKSVSGYLMPNVGMYTGVQSVAMTYPEFGYKSTANVCDVLIKSSNKWQLKPNSTYGQKHFIPIYYPDGEYVVRFIKGDFWTPAGALNVSVNSEPINIKGNAYEDWYIQH